MDAHANVDVGCVSALEHSVCSAAATWSEVFVIEPAVFTAHLVARLPPHASSQAVTRLHTADLYLACACGLRIPAAVAELEPILRTEATAALNHMRVQPAVIDDICQMTREKVLVGAGGRPAAIAKYAGRGTLRGWLRVVATRIALNALRGRQPEVPLEDALIGAGADPRDPELSFTRGGYGAALARAVERALGTLAAEDRVLLRQRFIDGLLPAQIGALHRKHRVTILRKLARILRTLRSRTEEFLRADLGCGCSTALSVVHAALSQTQPSIQRYLAPQSPNC